MKIEVKPPYIITANATGLCQSPGELLLAHAVDEMMQSVRLFELANPAFSEEDRNTILEKHVNAAYEYYSHFSKDDLALMLMIEKVLKQKSKEVEDDEE